MEEWQKHVNTQGIAETIFLYYNKSISLAAQRDLTGTMAKITAIGG